MGCSNCFNGCADITSDQCVKYTGVDIPGLDIHTGDTLLTVENKITQKILTLMDGTGIVPVIVPEDVCPLVQSFLPCCPPLNLNVVLTALVKSICAIDVRLLALETQVDDLQAEMDALNANYTIPSCLAPTPPTTDTHDLLQIAINKICAIEADLTANYVPIDDIDDFIAAYIASTPASTKYYTRMIPWVAVPLFFVPPGAFDSNGAGIVGSDWEKIYICNGTSHAGIPDLRGRVIVGATTMGPAPYDPVVDPSIPGNPTYAVNDKRGANTVLLTQGQLPSHTHTPAVTVTDPKHSHTGLGSSGNSGEVGGSYPVLEDNPEASPIYTTDLKETGITVGVTIGNTGGGESHPNVQPGIGATMIMHIP